MRSAELPADLATIAREATRNGSKLAPASLAAWLPIEAGWTVVTDASAPDESVRPLRERGTSVRVVSA